MPAEVQQDVGGVPPRALINYKKILKLTGPERLKVNLS